MANIFEKNKSYLGDCLELMPQMESEMFDAIICDLPFGTTRNKWDSLIPLDKLWEQYNRLIKPKGAIILFAQTPFDKILGCSNLEMLKYEWIWEKSKATGFLNSKYAPLKAHENILVFSKSSACYVKDINNAMTYNPQGLIKKAIPTINKGDRGQKSKGAGGDNYDFATKDAIQEFENYPKSIIRFNVEMRPIHPTQKPTSLLEFLANTYTNKGELILDNCAGSGTTAEACYNTGRNYIQIEKEQKYFDLILKREKSFNKKYYEQKSLFGTEM
jgi:site-specific DNA-methyltransferase (adenine-specific)